MTSCAKLIKNKETTKDSSFKCLLPKTLKHSVHESRFFIVDFEHVFAYCVDCQIQ